MATAAKSIQQTAHIVNGCVWYRRYTTIYNLWKMHIFFTENQMLSLVAPAVTGCQLDLESLIVHIRNTNTHQPSVTIID